MLNDEWMRRLLLPAEVYALLLPQLMPAFSHEPINMRDASCIGACFKNGELYHQPLPRHQSSLSLWDSPFHFALLPHNSSEWHTDGQKS